MSPKEMNFHFYTNNKRLTTAVLRFSFILIGTGTYVIVLKAKLVKNTFCVLQKNMSIHIL